MIELTVYPRTGMPLNKNAWEYIKAIADHISAEPEDRLSFTEYAIRFSALAKNIELESVFGIQYRDGWINLYSLSDWSKRNLDETVPIVTIQNGPGL